MVLRDRNDDLISLGDTAHSVAVCNEVQRLCRISCKDDLAGILRADKTSDLPARLLIVLRRVNTPLVESAERICILRPVKPLDCVQHLLRAL